VQQQYFRFFARYRRLLGVKSPHEGKVYCKGLGEETKTGFFFLLQLSTYFLTQLIYLISLSSIPYYYYIESVRILLCSQGVSAFPLHSTMNISRFTEHSHRHFLCVHSTFQTEHKLHQHNYCCHVLTLQ